MSRKSIQFNENYVHEATCWKSKCSPCAVIFPFWTQMHSCMISLNWAGSVLNHVKFGVEWKKVRKKQGRFISTIQFSPWKFFLLFINIWRRSTRKFSAHHAFAWNIWRNEIHRLNKNRCAGDSIIIQTLNLCWFLSFELYFVCLILFRGILAVGVENGISEMRYFNTGIFHTECVNSCVYIGSIIWICDDMNTYEIHV